MKSRDPKPGRDERLEYNGREPTESHCRVCGRAMIEHPSRACRSCRKDKPDGWIVGQPMPETPEAKPGDESEEDAEDDEFAP